MNITGYIAICNNEKCPHCDLVIKEKTDVLGHFIKEHLSEMTKILSEEENK